MLDVPAALAPVVRVEILRAVDGSRFGAVSSEVCATLYIGVSRSVWEGVMSHDWIASPTTNV